MQTLSTTSPRMSSPCNSAAHRRIHCPGVCLQGMGMYPETPGSQKPWEACSLAQHVRCIEAGVAAVAQVAVHLEILQNFATFCNGVQPFESWSVLLGQLRTVAGAPCRAHHYSHISAFGLMGPVASHHSFCSLGFTRNITPSVMVSSFPPRLGLGPGVIKLSNEHEKPSQGPRNLIIFAGRLRRQGQSVRPHAALH